MGREITYFMWGYQGHFRFSLKSLAEKAFSALGSGITPGVFLVGMRTEERKGSHPVCVEPEDCVVAPAKFEDLARRVDVHLKAPKASYWVHSSDEIADRFEVGRYRAAVTAAVRDTVESATDTRDSVTFCSAAVPVENYLVVAVLQLPRGRVEAWPSLLKDTVSQLGIRRSMIEALAYEFVDHCTEALSDCLVSGFRPLCDTGTPPRSLWVQAG